MPRLTVACFRLARFALLFCAAAVLRANPPSWAGGSGNASDNSKWSTGSAPSSADTVAITTGSVSFNGNTTYGALLLSGGDLNGNASLTLGNVTTSSWTGGSLSFSNGHGLSVSNGATLSVNGTGSVHEFNGSAITNSGTFDWSAGELHTGNSGSITNNGTFKDSASSNLSNAFGGSANFNNAGTYNKNATGTTSVGLTFANTGTVNVNLGTLALTAGGSNSAGATLNIGNGAELKFGGGTFTINSAGDITDSGGTITFAGGNVSFGGGSVAVGNVAIAGGTVNFTSSGGATSNALSVSSGTLASGTYSTSGYNQSGGSVSGASVTLAGAGHSWTGGDMNGNGTLTLFGESSLAISGASTHDFNQHAIVNGGTINWSGGDLATGQGGSITNSGSFNDTASGNIVDGFGSAGQFSNAGTYAKNAGGTTSIGLQFANSGTISIGNGTLELHGGGANAAGAKINVGSGSGLRFAGGAFTIASGDDIVDHGGTYTIAAGTVTITSGNAALGDLAISGGTLGFMAGGATTTSLALTSGTLASGNFTTPVYTHSGGSASGAAVRVTGAGASWTGGDMNGGGTLTLDAAATLSIGGTATHDFSQHTIANNGSITWSVGDLRTGQGGGITNNGTFNDTASTNISNVSGGTATFTNGGTYNKTGAGNTTIGITFANHGTVNVGNGTLKLAGGGSSGAAFTTTSNAVTEFGSDYSLTSGAALDGGGKYVHSGGTLDVGADLTVQNLAQSAGTLSANGHVTVGNFDLTGGTLGGASGGELTVTGNMTWTGGGDMNGGGKTTIGSGVALTIDDTTGTARNFSGHEIVNDGTVNWNSAYLQTGQGGKFTNAAGATFNDFNGANYHINNAYSGSSSFDNAGTYNRNAGGTTFIDITFNNTGSVNVQAGNLEIGNGGTIGATGTMTVAGDSNIYFRNGYTASAGASLHGDGQYWLTGGTFAIDGILDASTFNQTDGTLSGSNTLKGKFTWSGGDWNATVGSGEQTTIAAGSTLELTDSSDHTRTFDGRAIVNHGTVNWTSGYIQSGDGGSFENASDGVFNDLNRPGDSIINPFGGSFAFTNDGTYSKTTSGTTTVAVPFTNNGTLSIAAGQMVFNGTFTNTGSLVLANGATAQFANPLSFTTTFLGGTGTIQAPSVTAGGVVSPGNSPGTLTITGDFTLLNTSVLLIELGGTAQGTQYDYLNVGGNVTIGGLLDIKFVNGFGASVLGTDQFTILSAGGASGLGGAFANVASGERLSTLDGLGSFQVNYTGMNSVTLTNFSAVPEPSTYVLLSSGLLTVYACLRRRRRG